MHLRMPMLVLVILGSREAWGGQSQQDSQGDRMHSGDDVGEPRIRDGSIERYSNLKEALCTAMGRKDSGRGQE